MTDLPSDGYWKVSWVPSIAIVGSPTVAELTAAGVVSLETYITATGLKVTPTTDSVDNSNLASTFSTELVGRRKFEVSIESKRQQGTDAAWNAMYYGAVGFVVVRYNLLTATAWASGQLVEVFPVQCSEPERAPAAMNEIQKYTVAMKVTSDPNTRAVIA